MEIVFCLSKSHNEPVIWLTKEELSDWIKCLHIKLEIMASPGLNREWRVVRQSWRICEMVF